MEFFTPTNIAFIIFFLIFALLVYAMFRLYKKTGVNILEDPYDAVFLLVVIPIILLFKFIESIFNKKYNKTEVTIVGPKVISRNKKDVTFVMLASKTGQNKGVVYTSNKLTAPEDDTWLKGEVSGLKTSVLIHPSNPEKYKLPLNDIPPSQYA